MERRLLCHELWPHFGSGADVVVFAANAGFNWHFRGPGHWKDLPQPSTRAAAVLDLAGVDWRQHKKDLGVLHVDTGVRPEIPAGWPEVDGDLVEAYDEIVKLDATIANLVKGLGDKDPEDVPEYMEAEENRYGEIEYLSGMPSESVRGMRAKAMALKLPAIVEDDERAGWIASSLADDVLRLCRHFEPASA